MTTPFDHLPTADEYDSYLRTGGAACMNEWSDGELKPDEIARKLIGEVGRKDAGSICSHLFVMYRAIEKELDK